jgi:hypothetical protein
MVNKFSKLFLIVFILGAIALIINGYMKKSNIEMFGKESIGKYISHDSWGKGETNYFIFYIDGNKYEGNGGRVPNGFQENIGKFYRIRYSEKYKGSIHANFDEQVTDTTEILNAGFSKDDIK